MYFSSPLVALMRTMRVGGERLLSWQAVPGFKNSLPTMVPTGMDTLGARLVLLQDSWPWSPLFSLGSDPRPLERTRWDMASMSNIFGSLKLVPQLLHCTVKILPPLIAASSASSNTVVTLHARLSPTTVNFATSHASFSPVSQPCLLPTPIHWSDQFKTFPNWRKEMGVHTAQPSIEYFY